MCVMVPTTVRHGAKNVSYGAENVRHGAENLRHAQSEPNIIAVIPLFW